MADDPLSAANGTLNSSLAGELISARSGAQVWWLEDDRHLCRLVEARLRACGWRLTLFHKGQDLLDALRQDQPDLLILDRLLPGISGTALLKNLRQQHHAYPVLMLSAMGSPDERIEGLELGANDYLPKPFRFRELIWRIERLLLARPPRLTQHFLRGAVVHLGPLTLDPAQYRLRDGSGAEVPLSRGDMALLRALLQVPGAMLSREQLVHATGSLVDASTSRSLDVRLSRLRRKLRHLSGGSVGIETVRCHGYRLALPLHQSGTLLAPALVVAVSPLVIPPLGVVPPALGLLSWLVLTWVLHCISILWQQVLQPLPVCLAITPLRRSVERLNRLQAAQQRQLAQRQGRLRHSSGMSNVSLRALVVMVSDQ